MEPVKATILSLAVLAGFTFVASVFALLTQKRKDKDK